MKLQHSDDRGPGIHRVRHGKKFSYINDAGKTLLDEKTIQRIHKLAIPPAYTDVWIAPKANGHIQATGRDQRGRKQYRYHADWIKSQDSHKYHRMIEFAKTLPHMRQQMNAHLKLKGLPRKKVIAAVVTLLEKTLIRVGNEAYARDNHSYGLTTLRKKHARVTGSRIHFDFRGKSGVHHIIDLQDQRLAHIIRRCEELHGIEIFQYLDDRGKTHDVRSEHVNEYLKELSGRDFTAKDFRTWAGTMLAAEALKQYQSFSSQTEAKKQILSAIESVSKKLGNTKAICRKCYIHPDILNAHMDGTLAKVLSDQANQLLARNYKKLPRNEAMILVLLEKNLRTC